MPDDGYANELHKQIDAMQEVIENHRRELLRLHPEVSNFQTVEELKREIILLMEAYVDLLKHHVEMLTRNA